MSTDPGDVYVGVPVVPGGAEFTRATQSFAATAGQTLFLPNASPISGSVLCFDNGVMIADFTVVGTALTFDEGRTEGHVISIHYEYTGSPQVN